MKLRTVSAVIVSSLFISIALPLAAAAQTSDGTGPSGNVGDGYAMVIFSQPPLAAWPDAARLENGRLDMSSGANARYRASLARARNDFKEWLRSTGSPARVVREYDTVVNGVAVQLNGTSLDALKSGPGVTTVEPTLHYRPNMNRSVASRRPTAAAPRAGSARGVGAALSDV